MKTTAITLSLFLLIVPTVLTGLAYSDFSESASSSPVDDKTSTNRATIDWLVMVYDDGDNSLTDFIANDIEEMTAGGSTGDFVMLVLADFGYDRRASFDFVVQNTTRTNDTDTDTSFIEEYERAILVNNQPAKLYYVQHNKLTSLSIEDNLGLSNEPNMADPDTLISFLNFGLSTYPAENTMLILADHGLSFKGFMQDEYSKDYMTPSELQYALSVVGHHFDIIGFDACLMASASMLYEVAGHCDYVIASEMTEPGDGWDYTVFSELTTDPSLTPMDFGKKVIDAYAEQYYPSIDYTIALYDTSKLISALLYFDDLTNSLLPIASSLRPLFTMLKFGSNYSIQEVYYYSDIYDIIAFLSSLEKYLGYNSLSSYATNLITVRSLLLSSMIYYNYNANLNSDLTCISLYIPSSYTTDNSFQNTLFAQHFQWNELLYAVYISPNKFKEESPPNPLIQLNESVVEVRIPTSSLPLTLHSPDAFGLGNTIYTITASVNGNPPSNGFYKVSSATIIARIYDGTRYSTIVEQTYDNIKGVYIESPPKAVSYPLSKGWNVIGVSIDPNEHITASSLIDTYYGLEVVVRYDSINGTYISYTDGSPDSADFQLEEGQSYYLYTQSDITITLYGREVQNPVIHLYEGWNLIASYSDMTTISLTNKSPGNIKIIYNPNTDQIYYSGYPPSDFNLHEGDAIWVYSISDTSFIIQ